MWIDIALLILGLIVLIVGGEFLVKGAVGIAEKAHLSKLVIGMTVVSFGTSAPELIVSLKAAFEGAPDIAMGNVIGSNIANIALVLGITVLIFPIVVDRNSKVLDWPMMMLASILFYVFAFDLNLQRWEGAVMFAILVAFITYLIVNSRKKTKLELRSDVQKETTPVSVSVPKSVGFLFLGLVGLYFGAEWLLNGSVSLAKSAGMSERVIGITIIAFGTSVPELVTCAVAAYRRETDISIGNLIGSNIFNIFAVIGLTSIIHPIDVSQASVSWDMIWMLAIVLLLLPLMIIGKKFGRLKGFTLLLTYVLYIVLLLFQNSLT
ncbi:MAG: calcium/sodium antiporter [Lishizhenia sp.]